MGCVAIENTGGMSFFQWYYLFPPTLPSHPDDDPDVGLLFGRQDVSLHQPGPGSGECAIHEHLIDGRE